MCKRVVVATACVLVLSTSQLLADESALTSFQMMKPELAIKLAKATLQACRDAGYQTAVAVVDRSGITQVIIRDQLAGPHTPETARRKAWTSVTFRGDTKSMADVTQAGKVQSGARMIDGAMMIGGGVPIEAAGSIVGGIGVSGAPGGDLDHDCALKGIDAIADELLF